MPTELATIDIDFPRQRTTCLLYLLHPRKRPLT